MTTIGVQPGVTVHSIWPGCDACGAVLHDVPREIAEHWLDGHVRPVLLRVDMSIDGVRQTWRRR